ncbi:uncharacterized protein EDB93DRAFT_1104965 [Suillus bovinus]|uniref:uncharacterized protein n=1 Tax=Suillus bovinus TaxID=48563 RepID=UPI001B8647BB|nr:uncharacterized protein EDB93DRAFT_1104965 [Suillus bovinus]KAG2144401.1 hypothetical protein EDB93DRAFT_1104965 [Suillus bovinus]
MGLRRTQQQGHTVNTIRDAMADLHETYPNAGAREMVNLLFYERSQYGLGLHTGIKLFSGHIMWIRVWHSNRNPQLILSYYLDTLEKLGHMPMVTQSDPGSENFGIVNAHTMLHQWHDPALQGTLQHRWMRSKKNVMPEITWSQLRRRFMPGFEALLDHGVLSGWYDTNNTLQLCIHFFSAEDFGMLDFKIKVEHEALDHVRNIYITPSHPVFDLVPRPFGDSVQHCYDELGCPLVTRHTVWEVYLRLLGMLRRDEIPHHIDKLGNVEEDIDTLQLLEDHDELPYREESDGTYYMGGVGGGLGLGIEHLNHLERLARDEEPEITLSVDENDGLDHAGLVVWEFSDDSGSSDTSDADW